MFALVPNFYGARLAVETGIQELTPVISLSESHKMANVKRTVNESVEEIKQIRQTFPDIRITQDIACVFGCPFEGEMQVEALLELVGKLREIGVDACTLDVYKRQHLDHPHLPLKSLHVVQIGEHGVKALDSSRPGRDDHVLSGSGQLHAGAGDHGL